MGLMLLIVVLIVALLALGPLGPLFMGIVAAIGGLAWVVIPPAFVIVIGLIAWPLHAIMMFILKRTNRPLYEVLIEQHREQMRQAGLR